MKLLFISSTYIGDAVLSTGLLAELLRRDPDAEVTIACGRAALPIFEAAPNVVRLIGIQKRGRIGHWLDLWREVVGTPWDMVVDLRGSAFAWTLRARERRIYRPGPDLGHGSRALARLVGLDELPPPVAWSNVEHEAWADRFVPKGSRFVALGPTGNWAAKIWPADRFAELARRLSGADGPFPGTKIAVLGAPGEEAAVAPLLSALAPERRIDLVGKAPLGAVPAILKRASLFVGNDSSPLYMATAAGIPAVGLFGPTPGLFGPRQGELIAPWAPKVAEARTPIPWQQLTSSSKAERDSMTSRMDSLTVDAVEAAIRKLLQRLGTT
jgi:ADP-heptose:LPS heptosyltransferase